MSFADGRSLEARARSSWVILVSRPVNILDLFIRRRGPSSFLLLRVVVEHTMGTGEKQCALLEGPKVKIQEMRSYYADPSKTGLELTTGVVLSELQSGKLFIQSGSRVRLWLYHDQGNATTLQAVRFAAMSSDLRIYSVGC